AYHENLTLRGAGLRVYEARAELGIASGEQFPQSQKIAGGYTRERISTNESVLRDINRVVSIDPTFHRWQLGFDAGWEVDIWGKFRRNVQSAEANLLAQVANYDDVLVTLVGDVASTYVTIRELQRLIAISRVNAAGQKESLRITKIRFKDGATTELDVNEATALYNNTLATIPKLEAELAQAYNAMSVLIGQPPSDLRDVIRRTAPIPRAPAEVAIGVPAELLRRRPDIRAAEYEAAA
ncbi:MAG: TolC family protein, partial [Hyphomicrobiales bacterium]